MRRVFSVLLLIAIACGFAFAGGQEGKSPATVKASASSVKKKVRITNDTTDADIRVWCMRCPPKPSGKGKDITDYYFVTEVPQGGSPVTQSDVDTGSRGVIVFETLNETVIAKHDFELDPAGKNVDLK